MVSDAPLAPGLYLVATPIGNARDITLRALDVLRKADVIAAEDTRSARRLMEIHAIALGGRPMLPYHDHNGERMRPRLLAALAAGQSVAYVSDAGTPLVADPGYRLAREAAEHAVVTAVPGPSAVLAALSVAGLPTDRFLFAGFPPPQEGARKRWLGELAAVPATLVLFESAKRCSRSVPDMVGVLGADRAAALCRELTKLHEEVRRGTLSEIAEMLVEDPPRGEVVIVIDRDRGASSGEGLDEALEEALGSMSLKDATEFVAEATGLPRRQVYQAALRLRDDR